MNEEREALTAEVNRGQRLWLAARRRRAGVPYLPVVVHRRAVPYKPAGTGSKSAPDQRRRPWQDLSEETDGEGLPEADETVVPHTPAVTCNPSILYKPPGSGAKSAPGQRLVIVPRLLPRHELSDETDQNDWSDVDETMPSGTSEKLEMEQSRMLQHELGGEETMQEGLSWPNGHEPMRIVPEQDREYNEIQYERAEDSYGLGDESGLDSGEETVEEDWSNINPKTLLTPGISINFG